MADPYSDEPGSMDPHSIRQIETAIRAAGDYVQPSGDLRPRTLEAAREHCGDLRAEQKVGGFVIAVLLCVVIMSPAFRYVDFMRAQSVAPTAIEMQRRGLQHAADPHVGSNWGLTEAFTQLRRLQADRFGATMK